MKIVVSLLLVCAALLLGSLPAEALREGGQPPAPGLVDSPTVKVLTGLTVPEFEAEMQLMTQALGLSCGSCHARGNFASDANPRKIAARRMLEMTKALNAQYFADYKPQEGQSRLGRVTCFTCHQGDTRPKTQQH